ncbi:Holliday junction branch migration protein RuvA [Candidatus Peregrinibacteria bacterium]|nr:Holliday junction branch migration protein RuvA [Candidatus Peregrinibacteria bacterium]
MIAYLKGNIVKKTGRAIVIDTGNIGYLVYITKPLAAELLEDTEIKLFIHSHIKEDIFDLYGFINYKDLEFFERIIGISGIGPKTGLEILSLPPDKIKKAIINEDEAFICQTPGIGKKTAKRIILELKDKLETEDLENISLDRTEKTLSEVHREAVDALLKLGYQRHEVIRTLKDIPKEIIEAEEIITYFLKNT